MTEVYELNPNSISEYKWILMYSFYTSVCYFLPQSTLYVVLHIVKWLNAANTLVEQSTGFVWHIRQQNVCCSM